jgi:hypothetical protein
MNNVNDYGNVKVSVKKRILIVTGGFFPEISPRSFRATELAKEFSRQEHEVVVITKNINYNYADFQTQYKINIKLLGRKILWDIPILTGKYLNYISRGVRRILLMLFEYPDIELMFKVKKALKYETGYDLLISNAVPFPIHWGVAWSRNRKKRIAKIWVADCGDPYMGNTNDTFRKLFYFKYLEKWFCRKADYISIPTIGYKEQFYKEFHEKIIAIPQGINFEDVKRCQKMPDNPVPTFAFAGSLIKGVREPGKLLDFLSSVVDDFAFIVYTKSIEFFKPYFPRLGTKLQIKDYIPRDELIYNLSCMDFLINIGYDPITQSPSKLIDYALSGRPILSFSSNEIDMIAIKEFLSGDYTHKFLVDCIEKYNIKNVSNEFLKLSNNGK